MGLSVDRVGGLSCITSIVAKESHTAVSLCSDARQTNSSRGSGGRERSVASEGNAVIALIRSLNDYGENRYISYGPVHTISSETNITYFRLR